MNVLNVLFLEVIGNFQTTHFTACLKIKKVSPIHSGEGFMRIFVISNNHMSSKSNAPYTLKSPVLSRRIMYI